MRLAIRENGFFVALLVLLISIQSSNAAPVYFSPNGGSVTAGSSLNLWSDDESATLTYSVSVDGGNAMSMSYLGRDIKRGLHVPTPPCVADMQVPTCFLRWPLTATAS